MDRQQMRRRILEHVLDRPEHQRQRRAEFMADVRKEGRLRTVELRQRLRAPPLLLIGLCVGDRRRDLAGGETEEAPIVVIEQAERVESDDKNACAASVSGRQNRNEGGLSRRMGPGSGRDVARRSGFADSKRRARFSIVELHRSARAMRRRLRSSWGRPVAPARCRRRRRGLRSRRRVRRRRSSRTAGRAGSVRALRRSVRRTSRQLRAWPASAARSLSWASCRSPITRRVSSLLAQKIPPTVPSSFGIGL